jgi:predicted transcriptional regulator
VQFDEYVVCRNVIMGRKKRHNYKRQSDSNRGQAVELRKAGWKLQDIADEIGCTPHGVHYTLKKHEETGSVSDQKQTEKKD